MLNKKLLENLKTFNTDQLAGIRMGLALADGLVCKADLRGDNETVTKIATGVNELKDAVISLEVEKAGAR